MFNVLIVTDFEVSQENLELIWKSGEHKLIDCVLIGKEVIGTCMAKKPDVVIMYLSIQYDTRMNIIRKIKVIDKKIKVLVFSADRDRKNIFRALKNGADGYMICDIGMQDISIMVSDLYHETENRQNIVEMNRHHEEHEAYGELYKNIHFTDREKEVLKLVMEGLSNGEIAMYLGISIGRARNIVADLMNKCMVQNRTQLAVLGVKINMPD